MDRFKPGKTELQQIPGEQIPGQCAIPGNSGDTILNSNPDSRRSLRLCVKQLGVGFDRSQRRGGAFRHPPLHHAAHGPPPRAGEELRQFRGLIMSSAKLCASARNNLALRSGWLDSRAAHPVSGSPPLSNSPSHPLRHARHRRSWCLAGGGDIYLLDPFGEETRRAF